MSKNKTPSKPIKKNVSKKAVSRKTTTAKKVAVKKSTPKVTQVAKSPTPAKVESTGMSCCAKKKIFFAAIVVIIGALLFVKFNDGSTGKSDSVRIDKNSAVSTAQDVEDIIANWVVSNPELILESVINMQKKQAQKQIDDAGKNISKKMKDLYNAKDDPSISPNGYDVAIIEFFDYNCGYCKKSLSVLEDLAKSDKKLKIIFKELPILGKSSEDLSKVSLAVNILAPSKYFAFHQGLMRSKARTTEEAIKIASALGIAPAKLKRTLTKFASKIEKKIADNRSLATSIGVNGTPAFLIGETLKPGAVDVATIKKAIKEERSK
jgi:protein-disulfide isomerase